MENRIRAGHYILESKTERRTSYYLVQCVKCGHTSWRSNGFLKAKAICPNCSGGKAMHNARGYGQDPLYKRYAIIMRRVQSAKKYIGVTMCDEWAADYQAFKKWALENGYKPELTIDRIDNSKGYSPDNCRWATPKQQANNRRSNVCVIYEGNKYTLSELADFVNLPRNTVKIRYEHGWSIDDITKTPYKARKKWSEKQNEAERIL